MTITGHFTQLMPRDYNDGIHANVMVASDFTNIIVV